MSERKPRYRAHQWIDTKTLKPIYSIQARVGRNSWAHVHDRGKPLFFATAKDRDAVLEDLEMVKP